MSGGSFKHVERIGSVVAGTHPARGAVRSRTASILL